MATFEEVRGPLEEVIKVIFKDRTKLTSSTSDGGLEGGRITAWRLEQAAGNYLFNDHPERFDITRHEGQMIRNYFESNFPKSVEDLHRKFPQYMDDESADYMATINQMRARGGLPPLDL